MSRFLSRAILLSSPSSASPYRPPEKKMAQFQVEADPNDPAKYVNIVGDVRALCDTLSKDTPFYKLAKPMNHAAQRFRNILLAEAAGMTPDETLSPAELATQKWKLNASLYRAIFQAVAVQKQERFDLSRAIRDDPSLQSCAVTAMSTVSSASAASSIPPPPFVRPAPRPPATTAPAPRPSAAVNDAIAAMKEAMRKELQELRDMVARSGGGPRRRRAAPPPPKKKRRVARQQVFVPAPDTNEEEIVDAPAPAAAPPAIPPPEHHDEAEEEEDEEDEEEEEEPMPPRKPPASRPAANEIARRVAPVPPRA